MQRCAGGLAIALAVAGLGCSPVEFRSGLGAGVVAAARSDGASGSGWCASFSPGATPLSMTAFSDFAEAGGELSVEDTWAPAIEYAVVSYDGIETSRLGSDVILLQSRPAGLVWGSGFQGHLDEEDAWGVGLRATAGLGAFGKHLEFLAGASLYLWLGQDSAGDFASGAEIDARVMLTIRL